MAFLQVLSNILGNFATFAHLLFEELRTLKEEKKQIKYSTGSQPSRQKGGGQREVVPVAAPSSMKTATAAKTNLVSPGAVQEKQDTASHKAVTNSKLH
ncbi:unnamed protein product [Hermetia illucens]|uniref:Uncharacterized protein n=1 Tax=Hermetia illucens TaxID=343691 RepID=A0A7R8UCK1_HERIL|nr:unnamed protein product [Hermetia illucens]